jgi:hypothetical protein
MKKPHRKLPLERETLRTLAKAELRNVGGGDSGGSTGVCTSDTAAALLKLNG